MGSMLHSNKRLYIHHPGHYHRTSRRIVYAFLVCFGFLNCTILIDCFFTWSGAWCGTYSLVCAMALRMAWPLDELGTYLCTWSWFSLTSDLPLLGTMHFWVVLVNVQVALYIRVVGLVNVCHGLPPSSLNSCFLSSTGWISSRSLAV